MPTIIRIMRSRVKHLPYNEWPKFETQATDAQEARLAELRIKHPQLSVVLHSFENSLDALVALDRITVVQISPNGISTRVEAYPFCRGNPTAAHCIANGYCLRSPACSE